MKANKNFILMIIAILLLTAYSFTMQDTRSIYDHSFTTLEGKNISLAAYKGKKMLIVNTASECGYTPQYEQLEQISKEYKDNLIVIGFPSNEFGEQEPGTNEEIAEFCKKNYGVSFPMSQKISVKGDTQDPIYRWLTNEELNGVMDSEVKWNFQKYLIDENGKLIGMYPHKMRPDDPTIIAAITAGSK